MTTTTLDIDQIRQHHKTVWGHLEWPAQAQLAICGPATGWAARHVPVADTDALVEAIKAWPGSPAEVYVGVAPRPGSEIGQRGRGRGAPLGLPALVADVDFAAGGHAAGPLPLPSDAEALELIAAQPLARRTLIVHTGGGYHIWMPLDRPLDPAFAEGHELLARWRAAWVTAIAGAGRHIDAGVLADLARVLRVAGTVRHKPGCDPLPVRIVQAPSGGPVNAQELLDALPLPEMPRRRTAGARREREAIGTEADDDRPGTRLARSAPISEVLVGLGWTRRGQQLYRPDHSGRSGHDATVYPATDVEPEKVTFFGAHAQADFGLSDQDHSWSSWDLLGNRYCAGDWRLAARIAASYQTPDELAELLLAHPTPEALAAAVDGAKEPSLTRSRRPPTIEIDDAAGCMRMDRSVMASCAPRITATSVVVHDLIPGDRPEVTHDLEVIIDGDRHEIVGIADEDLDRPRSWLRWIASGVGTRVVVESSRDIERDIAEAIRARAAAEGAPIRRAIRRTGWAIVNGHWGWVSASGAMTAAGLDDSLRTDGVSGPAAAVALTPPDARLADDLRQVLRVPDVLGPTGRQAWTALVSAIGWALGGVTPPGTGLMLVGRPGSGKTTLLLDALGGLSSRPADLMTTVAASAGVIAQLGAGLHHAVTVLDDLHNRQSLSQRQHEDQEAAVDVLLRRSYGGAGAGRPRLAPSRRSPGRYEQVDPDPCSPLAILTGEEAPQGVESGSTLERFLSVEIVPGEPKFESAVDDLLGDGVWQRAFGGWVRWLAAQIDACATPGAPTDGLSRWTRQLADELEQVVDDIAASGRLTVRQAKVVAPLAVGLRMWCRFVAVAVVGEAEIGSLEADGTLVLTECAHRHAEVVMAPEDRGPAAVLDRLRQAAIGPRAWVDGPGMPQPADASHAELMGRAVGSTDGDLVALLPDIAARQIGMRSGAELVSALGELVVRDAQGRSRRVVSIRGQSVRCVCIRLSDWSGEDGAGVRAVAASASSFGSDESNEEF